MALPKEPRQKMINLMYLVLTALLALNVSAEIINAFKVVDNSLSSTNKVVNASTETLMASFEEKLKDPVSAEKAREWKPKADQAIALSKGIYDYIEGLKLKLKVAAGFDPSDPNSTFKEDNTNFTSQIFVKNKVGDTLFQKLSEYKKALLAIDPNGVGKQFANSLPINLEKPKLKNTKMADLSWAASYFYMTPTVAALTMLSKFQNDVKTSENRVVTEFHNQVGQVKVIFNKYEPIVGANSTYLFPGQELQITAGIGAFNSDALPKVTIAGRSVPTNENGVAIFKTAVSAGGGSIPVVIEYTDQDGSKKFKETKVDYTVGTPTGAFVSAEKVKVLYIGLDNELAVTGGSVGDEKVSVSINNGTLRKVGPGRYISSPTNTGTAVVTVNADGKASSFTFRVKNVPDPVPMVGQSSGGRMPANVFKAQQGVRADLKDFVFEGVTFTVTGYTLYCVGAGFQDAPGVLPGINSNSFAPAQSLIQKCRPGTTVVVDEIRAVGPGGTSRKLPPMVFNLY